MKLSSKIFLVCLCVTIIASSLLLYMNTNPLNLEVEEDRIYYSTSYRELLADGKSGSQRWKEGMVSGNGLQGVITSGAPYMDTLIYQNIHFVLPNQNAMVSPVSSGQLSNVRQAIVEGRTFTDNQSYDNVYSYHPGATLRLTQSTLEISQDNYKRYTNYSTAEVGVKYTDSNGEWERTTFTSQVDGVTITRISESSSGKKINMILSVDQISNMANFGDGSEVDLEYKIVADEDANYIGIVAHYPNYANSTLPNGGYSTICYIVCEGGSKELINSSIPSESQYVGETNSNIKITNATNLYVIAKSDRDTNMCTFDEFPGMDQYDLVDELVEDTHNVVSKYKEAELFNYDKALKNHLDIYSPMFEAVQFLLGGDSTVSNDDAIANTRLKDTLDNTLAERAYYSGRYAQICCAGTSTSRLFGMWTGEWVQTDGSNNAWGSKYTMDANVNLQTSSMNTSNVSSAPIGYAYFILRQVGDWEDNAYATHGYTDCIQAPVNTDGDNAVFSESCYPYPFRYWNAGSSWMLQPLYESLQCYGDINIPLSEEFNLDELKSLLSPTETDLTSAQIQAIENRGYLKLREDILYPLLVKAANYWEQLMVPNYYTTADGDIKYDATKTELGEEEKYCIVPSYSPENNPSNYSSPACANSAIDIAACNSNLQMLIDVMKQIDSSMDVSKWENLMEKVPVYLYDSTGAIKEWATTKFTENNTHRHLSHLYCAWPLFETQADEDLKQAAIQAVKNRQKENAASHALVHSSLISARLKDGESVTTSLVGLMNSRIYYNSLMTNHNTSKNSCYCTDYAIGYVGIVNESLIYSTKGKIEILPALPTSGFDTGLISGVMARTQAEIKQLTWSVDRKSASVTIKSNIAQKIEITCGKSSKTNDITFKAGETKTITFKFDK